MQFIFFCIFFFLGIILQGGNILNFIELGELNIKPDVLIILLVFFALRVDDITAIIVSFLLGFAADLIILPLGPFVIAYVLAGYAVSSIKKSAIVNSIISQSFLVFLTVLTIFFAASAIKFIANKDISSHLVFRAFATALYSALIAPFMIWFLELISPVFGLGKSS